VPRSVTRSVPRGLALGLLLLAGAATRGPVQAQPPAPASAPSPPREAERPRIDLRVEPRADSARGGATVGATVAVRGVLEAARFDPLLRAGFPARLYVRNELWSQGRWVDDLAAEASWEVVVRYDAVDASYEVVRLAGGAVTPLGSYRRFADARAAMELPYQAALRPRRGRQGYVTVLAELQVLEVSDLDEVRRWLRGEAVPAVRGRRNPGGALLGGVRTLASRVLGGEVRRLESRSATTRW
jgi:hypothetical protein